MQRINETIKEDAECEGIKLVGVAEAAMHDVHDIDSDNIDLSERVSMLNEDQRRIVDQVSDHLNYQRRHKIAACKCEDLKPLHMFVSGVGRTGKSFLIECIKTLVKEMWKDDASNDTLSNFNIHFQLKEQFRR